MRLKKLLISGGLCLFGAAAAMAQDTFPIVLTPAEGLPVQSNDWSIQESEGNYTSRVFTSSEAINKVRFTVTHTAPFDGDFKSYVYFTCSELQLFNAAGNAIELSAGNFATNAQETSEGPMAGICDNDANSYFCSAWGGVSAPVYGEHYVEVTLPEPVYGFSFNWKARNNYKNYPSTMAITINGAEYVPHGEYGMQVGDETAAQADKLVVLRSTDAESTAIYPAYAVSPAKPRTRRTPAADCLFRLETADGGFYVKHLLRNAYLQQITAAGSVDLTEKAEAGIYSFENGIISCNGFNLTLADNGLQASNSEAPTWTLLSATIENTVALAELKEAIDNASKMLNDYEAQLTTYDNGQIAALRAEIATATTMWEASSADAQTISGEIERLQNKAAIFYALKLQPYKTQIGAILDETDFQNKVGCKPVSQKTALTNLVDDLQAYITDSENITLAGVNKLITRVEAALAAFNESAIVETIFPVCLNTEYPNSAKNKEWNSPLFFLAQPTDKFRMTVTSTNTAGHINGHPYFALAEMFVYDGEGKKIDQASLRFSTNAQEYLEGPIEHINDGNFKTFFMSSWSSGTDAYHYVEVTLPEPSNCFSFGFVSFDRGDCAPVDIRVGINDWTPGTTALTDGVTYTNDTDKDAETITYTRDFAGTDGWQALYLPFAMNYEDWAEWGDIAVLSGISKSGERVAINFERVTSGRIAAHTPCVFLPKSAGEVTLTSTNSTLYAAPAEEQSVSCSDGGYSCTLYGTYITKTGLNGDGIYALSASGNFVKAKDASQALNPYRIYMQLNSGANNAPARIDVTVDGEATGIEVMEYVREEDNTYYDLTGRPVENPQSGVYIYNGKKIFIK